VTEDFSEETTRSRSWKNGQIDSRGVDDSHNFSHVH